MRRSAPTPALRLPALMSAWLLAATAASAGELRALVRDADGKPLADAVVVAVADVAGQRAGRPATPGTDTIIIDQVNKEFVPYVLPVEVGTSVNFPNRDNIRHHVYSFSDAKRFELPLYIGDPATPVLFDKPGTVILGCNIHDWMIAYVYVANSPYYAKTDAAGTATLAQLPSGHYKVRVWHPRLAGAEDQTTKPLAVTDEGVVEASWQISLTPDFRIPRAPVPGQAGY
ncbi:MAG: hypothetical protein H6945_15375 [Zoogloeaceae bacterium]|nr:hypothetical protein [Rhodocyclaceae bacterium]MCP5237117.1 hypothetical protein [Zoogloeaceae bacterium]